jgi:hypothetical protein
VFNLATVGKKPTKALVKIQNPGEILKLAETKRLTTNKSFKTRPITFDKAGSYRIEIQVGGTKKIALVKAKPPS